MYPGVAFPPSFDFRLPRPPPGPFAHDQSLLDHVLVAASGAFGEGLVGKIEFFGQLFERDVARDLENALLERSHQRLFLVFGEVVLASA